MKRYIRSTEDYNTTNFTTFELKNTDAILASKRYIADIEHKRKFSDELFQFIDEAYDDLGGFRSFKDMDRFINDSYLWYITYDGPEPSQDELDPNRIYVVSVYRNKCGMKLVGIARRKIANSTSLRAENEEVRRNANAALVQHIKYMSHIGWAEVSDNLEKWFNRVLGDKWIINPEYLKEHNVFDQIEPDKYDLHYSRPLRKDGPMITKIAYGTIRI